MRGGGVCSYTTLTIRNFPKKIEKTVMMPRIPDAHGLKNIGFNITKHLSWPNFLLDISSTFQSAKVFIVNKLSKLNG